MIKLKYSHFMGFPFSQSIQKLTSQNFPAATAYKIKLMADKMQKRREQISAEYRKVVDLYATKDESGAIVHPNPEDKNGFDVKEELMPAYKAAEIAFGETEFTINVSQITLKEIEKLEFTPAEMAQLDALIQAPLATADDEEAPPAGPALATVTQLPTAAEPAEATSEGSAS